MPAPDDVIATFEGGELRSVIVADRGGTTWSVIGLTEGISGTLAPATGPVRCGSTGYVRFIGTGTAVRAPIARAAFRPDMGNTVQFLDASAFSGIRLWLRSTTPAQVRVKVTDRNTATPGRVCSMCNDHFTLELSVGTDWQLHHVAFSELKQAGTGDPQPALARGALWSLEIAAPRTPQFSLDVDDISFQR